MTRDPVHANCPPWCTREHRAADYHYTSWHDTAEDDADDYVRVRALRTQGRDRAELYARQEESAVGMTLTLAEARRLRENLDTVIQALESSANQARSLGGVAATSLGGVAATDG